MSSSSSVESRLHQISIFGIALLGAAAIASAQTRIINSVPYSISSPGTYTLANNIISKANAKIRIAASNVVLDLEGHTFEVSANR
jgi:hypothetical protein